MAKNTNSSLPSLLLVLGIFLAIAGEALAGRTVPQSSKNVDKKEPEFLHHDRSVLIPGLGRILVPPVHHGHLPHMPHIPHSGIGAGTPRPKYIPGGDDTFVPNPGYEVPYPGRGASVPETARP
ncbi:hypothetical protein UlMin_014381 [Ulmus minor]